MSISEKLLEFTKSLDSTYEGESAADRYLREDTKMWSDIKAEKELQKMSMADRMSMGMGAMGTLYGSSAEQAGMPTQDWAAQNLTADGMNQAGMSLNRAAGNWTPEQMQVFQGIGAVPSQMMQPVQQPQMPQQPQLTQTQQNVVAGENSMNRMQQEVDYAKAQQAAQAKNQMAQQQQQNAGIASLSEEEVDTARDNTKSLVQQAVVDQTDNIDDTTQAAKETQGWSEEHFKGAIKVIDSLIEQTNPQSAEYMSLQNRRADLVRVYESQKGSKDPYRAMEGQIATNQADRQRAEEAAEAQLLADQRAIAVEKSQDIQAGIADETDTRQMLADWDTDTQMDTQMSGADDMYADLDSNYAARTMAQGFKSTDEEQARQQYSREIAQGLRKNDDRIRAQQADKRAEWDMNRADDQFAKLDDEVDTRQMLGIWDAETQMSEVDDMYADLDDEYDKRHQQKSRDMAKKFKEQDDIKREQAEDAEFAKQDELETQKMLADWDAETADDAEMGNIDDIYENLDADYAKRQQEKANAEADYLNDPQGDETKSLVATIAAEEKEAWEKGQVTANEAYQRIINDADQAYEDELAVEDAKIAEFNANLEGVAEEVASSGDENAVAGITKLKKEISNSVVNSDGTMKSSAEIRSMTAKLLKEALAIENKKNVDRDWGPAMMQFGLTLMSTPGNLLTGIGIAGKDALKMWQDIKKGDKDSVTAKRELALKYAELADTKDKATLDSKDNTYKKYIVDADGNTTIKEVKSPATAGERVNEIVENRSMLLTSGAYKKIPLPQLKEIIREYETNAAELLKMSSVTGNMEFVSGKLTPEEMIKKALLLYKGDEELVESLARARRNKPVDKLKNEAHKQITAFDGYMSNSREFMKVLNEVPTNSGNWVGSMANWVDGALNPLWNGSLTEMTTGTGATSASLEATFNKTVSLKFDKTVTGNVKMKSSIFGLAKQRLMSVFNESGRSISDKDMEREIDTIASNFGGTATAAKMHTAFQTAQMQDINTVFANHRGAYVKDSSIKNLKTDFLSRMQKENAQYVAGIMGWGNHLPDEYGNTGSGTPPPPMNTKASFVPDSGYTLNGIVLYKDDAALTSGLIQMHQKLLAQYKGDSAKSYRALTDYVHKNFDAELVPSILQKIKGK